MPPIAAKPTIPSGMLAPTTATQQSTKAKGEYVHPVEAIHKLVAALTGNTTAVKSLTTNIAKLGNALAGRSGNPLDKVKPGRPQPGGTRGQPAGGASSKPSPTTPGTSVLGFSQLGLALAGVTAAFALAGHAAYKFAALAAPDGLKAVGQAFDVLYATLGVALVPAFVMLGAAVLGAAQQLQTFIDANMGDIVNWYASTKNAFIGLTDAIVGVTRFLIDMAAAAGSYLSSIGKAVSTVRDYATMGAAFVGEKVGLLEKGTTAALKEDINAAGGAGAPKGRGVQPVTTPVDKGKSDQFNSNFNKILSSMKQSFASGKTGYQGVGDVRDQIQMQNLQTDLEREMLEIQKKALAATERVEVAIIKQAPVLGK